MSPLDGQAIDHPAPKQFDAKRDARYENHQRQKRIARL